MKTYGKLLFREVNKTRVRFVSILAIVLVGVGFLSGLLATTPDMQLTADGYYDDNNLFDVYVKGSLGLTTKDVEAIATLEGIKNVMPAYVTDINMDNVDGVSVARIYGVNLSKRGEKDFINDFVLTKGRMPQNATECVVCVPSIGSQIEKAVAKKLGLKIMHEKYFGRKRTNINQISIKELEING